MLQSSREECKIILNDLFNKLLTFSDINCEKLNEFQWIAALNALNGNMEEKEMKHIFKLIDMNTRLIATGMIGRYEWNSWIQFCQKENKYTNYINKLKELYLLQNMKRDTILLSTDDALCCYQWRLPKYMQSQIDLICYGYCRLKSCLFIPYDIIRICMYYFYNNNIIEKFKNTENEKHFKSGIFDYKSCKFYFKVYPHGEYGFSKDKLYLYIEWINGAKNISKIKMGWKLTLMEKFITLTDDSGTFYNEYGNYGDPDYQQLIGGSSENKLYYNDISHLPSLTFNFYVKFFIAYDQNNNIIFDDQISINIDDDDDEVKTLKPIIIDEIILQSNTSDTFTWNLSDDIMEKIKNAKPKDTIKSPVFIMHKLKWQIWLYPNGDKETQIGECHIILHLISLPIQIKSVHAYYEIKLDEAILSGIQQCFTFNELQMTAWNADILKTIDITSKDKVPSFTISMEILALLNKDDKNIDLDDLQINNNNNYLASLPIKTFEWKISSSLLDEIKNSTPSTSFLSPQFKVYCFTFILELYPQKKCFDDEADKDKPNVILQLHLLTMPVNIASVSISYSLKINETNTEFSWIQLISNDLSSNMEWDDYIVQFSKIEELDSLTFGCDIQILDVNFINNINNQIDQDIQTNMIKLGKPQYFEWIISSQYYSYNIPTGNVFRSAIFIMFGIKWYLRFIPKCYNDEDEMLLDVCCAHLPSNVSQISCHCKVLINEINFAVSHVLQCNDNKMKFQQLNSDLPRDKIEILEHITLKIEMTLISVYDEEENDVTDIYAECNDNYFEDMREEKKTNESNDFFMDSYNMNSNVWEIDELKISKMESPYFEIIEQEIEFKVELFPKNEHENAEIFISIKSMPKTLHKLSVMCGILIFEIGSEKLNVNVSGTVHFTPYKLTSLVIDTIELELDDAKQVTVIVNMHRI